MKKLYINYEFSTKSCGITGHFEGHQGYAILNPDGSWDASEYANAINRILYILKHGEDCIMITFGDGPFIADGLDQSYGRLIRSWGGGHLESVQWHKDGSIMHRFENKDGAVSDRKLAKDFLAAMIARHERVIGLVSGS